MIIAGEASGDLHGANLARELSGIDSGLHFSGIGGSGMAEAGVSLFYDISNLAVMGFVEILHRLKDIKTAMKIMENRLRIDRPDLLILIDYPGFNLDAARRAKKYNIPVLYYISPKIWAWREGRVESIKKYIDRMAVILPFEKKFYQGHGIEVDFVGNPLLDQVRAAMSQAEFKSLHAIESDATVVGLMPGSRQQEVAKLLPLFLETAHLINSEVKKCVFLLPLAPSLSEDDIFKQGGLDDRLDIRLVKNERYEAMAACDAAMAASGTLTMELAILKVPMVVCYRVSMLSYLLARPFIKVKYMSLVNLVAGKEVVPELLQKRATPLNIFRKLMPLLVSAGAKQTMQRELVQVNEQLGSPGASRRTAELAMAMLAAAG